MKTCTKCKIEKELSEFSKRGMNKNGVAYHSRCKKCLNEQRRRPKKEKSPYIIPPSKICVDCKIDKPMEDFHVCSLRRDGRQQRCKECNTIQSKKDYKTNNRKQLFADRSKSREIEFRNFCDKFKSNGCSYCDEKELCCLEFHHFDPSTKEYLVSQLYTKKSAQKLYDEIVKCIVVCANCHKKIHNGIIEAKKEDMVKL